MSTLVNFARFYATTKHAGQLYAGSMNYTHHLAGVEQQARTWWSKEYNDWRSAGDAEVRIWDRLAKQGAWNSGTDFLEPVVAATWLHDVIEDCGVKRKEIDELFGTLVGELVWRVTDEPGATRAIRHALTYPKMREFPLSIFIKLCDRIANVEQGGAIDMYVKEQEDFHRNLHTRGQFTQMWLHLDGLLRAHVA